MDKIVGVVGSNTQKIEKVTRTPSDIIGEEDLYFTVYLQIGIINW